MKPIKLTQPTNWSAKEDIRIVYQVPPHVMSRFNKTCDSAIRELQEWKRTGPRGMPLKFGYIEHLLAELQAINTITEEHGYKE